ncbi:MAG: cytochrome c oxidase subunit 3 family protein [Roseibium sp.]
MDVPGERPRPGSLEELPGELMMWVLIISELLVFGAGLAAFLGVRITDPAGFAAAQDHLHRMQAGVNTVVLITSGYFAACALRFSIANRTSAARLSLFGAMVLGIVFLLIKVWEYAEKIEHGISTETHPFFTFYYLLTGFHAAHVVAGILILGLVTWFAKPRNIEVAAAFWHMVDLVWVLLFPVIYLLR